MPFGADTKTNAGGNQEVSIPGSVLSNWVKVNDDAGTENDDAFLDLATSTVYGNVLPVEVPAGITRMMVRLACDADADAFTDLPSVRVIGTDSSGIPFRIDATASDDAALPLTVSADAFEWPHPESGDPWLWGDPASNGGAYLQLDLNGARTVYVLIDDEADIEDSGSAQVASEVWALFLN